VTEETERLAGGWTLTGFAGLCAGWWLVVARTWPLFPVGAVFIVHGWRSLQLGRHLASGDDDPGQRKALARLMTLDAVVLFVVAALPLLTPR
jgi:hypothetical protein